MATKRRYEPWPKYKMRLQTIPALQLRRRWRGWLPRLCAETTSLYRCLNIYKDLIEVVKANPATLRPPVFFNWARDNYVLAICVGLRRLSDVRTDVVSIGRLLRELEIRPEVVSRRSYRARQRRRGISIGDADARFDRFVGVGLAHLPKRAAFKDIVRVKQGEARVRRLVNKRLAHAAPLSALRRPPTFQEIEDALEAFDQVLVKYNALLVGSGLSTCHSTLLDWRRVLLNPWLRGRSDEWPSRYYGPQHVSLSFKNYPKTAAASRSGSGLST